MTVRTPRAAAVLRVGPARPPLRLLAPGAPNPPDPVPAARAALALVAEILAGTQPPDRSAGRFLPEIRAALAAHAPPVPPGALLAPPRVVADWTQRPTPHAVEAGAVVRTGADVRALALRLEPLRGRWTCVALEMSVRDGAPAAARRAAALRAA
ncbi:Rv3235 family protein [Actinomadura atramentaria]|uniref:Rv3235 family protein n=1 Tax=Actinomadura atramentaria TaxID=1990 RepID=UPI00037217DE|nr:Rv3235 family protein [Actinomadura atramentaria]